MASRGRCTAQTVGTHYLGGLRRLWYVVVLSQNLPSQFRRADSFARFAGELERHTIPKSQGRQEYYDARKVAWGDSFPHPPKNGPQPAPAALATEELKSKRDKFGEGKSKVRSKKAERTGRVKEEGIGRRGKGKQQSRSGEVQEFELEMGPDGQLRMM